MAGMSEDEKALRLLMPHMFDDDDVGASLSSGGGGGGCSVSVEAAGIPASAPNPSLIEPVASFLSRLEGIEQKSPAAPPLPIRALPMSPCFASGGHRAKSAGEWVDVPDLLCIERSDKRMVEELRILPPLDPKQLEDGLTRL